MEPLLERRLLDGAASLGIPVDPTLRVALDRYLELLVLWNRRINLSAVREPEAILERHFLDSLAAVPHVPASATSLIDVGSGAGFPGAVIALARPDLRVTLVESVHKKTAFLEALKRHIPIPKVQVRTLRVETLEDRADAAISRATWSLPEWLARGTALVNPGGTVLGMEGADQRPLPPAATRHPYALGASRRAIIVLPVPPPSEPPR